MNFDSNELLTNMSEANDSNSWSVWVKRRILDEKTHSLKFIGGEKGWSTMWWIFFNELFIRTVIVFAASRPRQLIKSSDDDNSINDFHCSTQCTVSIIFKYANDVKHENLLQLQRLGFEKKSQRRHNVNQILCVAAKAETKSAKIVHLISDCAAVHTRCFG